MSVIIVDKLMKIAGHRVMVVLIKGYWKNLISDGQFSSSCRLKIKKTQLLCHAPVLCCSTISELIDYQIVCESHAVIIHLVCRDVPGIHPVPGKCRVSHYSVLPG